MTDDRRRALQAMAEQQQADATEAMIAVKLMEETLQTMIELAKDLAAGWRDDGEPK